MKSYQITDLCHEEIRGHVQRGDVVIDATAGNGNDTEFLCSLVGSEGKVYAFDIQQQAIDHTRERISHAGYKADVILDGHQNMERYVTDVDKVSCVVFNFGYLPGGDHNMATKANTSIDAMEAALRLLKKGGLMHLCIYSGGDSGFEEKDAILAWLKNLNPKKYLVILGQYYNRPKNPPIPVKVIKL